jgi:hypothetical protein
MSCTGFKARQAKLIDVIEACNYPVIRAMGKRSSICIADDWRTTWMAVQQSDQRQLQLACQSLAATYLDIGNRETTDPRICVTYPDNPRGHRSITLKSAEHRGAILERSSGTYAFVDQGYVAGLDANPARRLDAIAPQLGSGGTHTPLM